MHIPEKLARPGYLWAAHYELHAEGTHPGYLALFGGNSTHTFFNPSPRQLLTRQSAQTKEFIAGDAPEFLGSHFRRRSAHRRTGGCTARPRSGDAGPAIQLGNYNAANAAVEDDLGAWYHAGAPAAAGENARLRGRAQNAGHGRRVQARDTP